MKALLSRAFAVPEPGRRGLVVQRWYRSAQSMGAPGAWASRSACRSRVQRGYASLVSRDLPPLDDRGLNRLAELGWTWDERSQLFVSDELAREPRSPLQARYLLWSLEHGARHPDDTAV